MKTELWMLIGTVGVLFGLLLVQSLANMATFGIGPSAGNREDIPVAHPGIAGRAERAVRNTIEGMALFAPLVLTAAVAGISNANTVLGAQIFFAARLVYAIVYVVGVPWLRSVVWGVGILGLGLLLMGIVTR
ncbi:MAG: MAPEG family protein [Hyphomicrobiaceae bacterium]